MMEARSNLEAPTTAGAQGAAAAHATDLFADGGDLGALMRAHDWAATPLGPVAGWPQSLQTSVSICLQSRFPIVVWWGPALVMFYNDAYRPMLGRTKHPAALGAVGRDVWPEVWHIIGPMLEGVLAGKGATWSDDQLLMLDRNGFPEECYFTFSYSPIRDESGGVGGVFTAVTETTERVLGARRLDTLRRLGEESVDAPSAEDVCRSAAGVLARNPNDLPFTLIYLAEPDGGSARLIAHAGLDQAGAHPYAPARVQLGDADARWPFSEAMAAGRRVPLDGRAHGGAPAAGSHPNEAYILPLRGQGEDRAIGFLVIGLSSHLAFGGDYQSFLELTADHIASGIAKARAYAAARERAEALAELDRAKTAFFSNISHEFRTPLTLQLGPLEDALARADLPSPVRDGLALAHRNSLRLLKLVNTLLDFSRLEAGRADACYESTDLAAVTADLASTFRSAIERAGLRLVIDTPPLPAPVFVDRDMWEKIVLNLLSNAFKFTL